MLPFRNHRCKPIRRKRNTFDHFTKASLQPGVFVYSIASAPATVCRRLKLRGRLLPSSLFCLTLSDISLEQRWRKYGRRPDEICVLGTCQSRALVGSCTGPGSLFAVIIQ